MENFSAKMDKFIEEYTKEHKNSGVLRVTVKDKIIYEKFIGYADVENKTPFTKDSMFTLYSLSKPFCAIGTMKLHDKGLIDVDKHPGTYLPEARVFDERLTIRHLLYHISGLPDFTQDATMEEKQEGATSEQLRNALKKLSEFPVHFEPGKGHIYANINYIIPALIIEEVTGMGYADYMKKEVFEPLGMKSAVVDFKGLEIENRVTGYEPDGRTDRVCEYALGAGDIVATVDDVYALNLAIKNKTMLSEKSWEEILTPSDQSTMGLGCNVTVWHNKKRITHNGGWRGFRTIHVQLPEEDFDIIYLSNSAWGDARGDYVNAIYNAYYGDDNNSGTDVKMDVGYIK